jgi:hypothetical protein
MIKLFSKSLLCTVLSLFLLACGSSKDKEDASTYSEFHLQFHSGSPASALTYLRVVNGLPWFCSVWRCTSLIIMENGQLALEFYVRLQMAKKS